MGALLAQNRRRLWPALAVIILAMVLLAGRAARATDGRAAAGVAVGGNTDIYLPHVSIPAPPPRLGFVPFIKPGAPDTVTITVITHAGDDRLFVGNREGRIWIVLPDGTALPKPFLDLKGKVDHEGFEQGLLGLAFHPDYPHTPYFYVAYTSSYHIVVARGEVNPDDPNQAKPALDTLITMLKPLIRPDDPGNNTRSGVHNAGDLKFGPDGYLYIPVGDGGPDPYGELLQGQPGDPNNHSQRRDVLLGSMLRIDPDPDRGLPPDCGVKKTLYSIPSDNPWLDDNGCDEIWAKGLRNPWRVSFDRLTGDFYISDVGEWQFEEINFLPANSSGGKNFGWHCWEGTANYSTTPFQRPDVAKRCDYQTTQFTFPVHEYNHEQAGRCSVTGGYVYRGSEYPALYGRYIFADWCSREAWTMARMDGKWQVDPAGGGHNFTTFGEDIHGELYAGTYLSGQIYKVVVVP